MKRYFSRAVALSLLAFTAVATWAQPEIAPIAPGIPKTDAITVTEEDADAMALIGAFYSKMRRATTFRGHLSTTKTLFKDKTVISTRKMEIQSSWIGNGQGEGVFTKGSSSFVYTTVSEGNTATERFSSLDNGMKNRRFYASKNVWSERDQYPNSTSMILDITRSAWTLALLSFRMGGEFVTEHRMFDGQSQIVLKKGVDLEFVFDAKSGNLRSWKVGNPEEISQFELSQIEFDAPLSESDWEWKVPQGATQVAPGSVEIRVDF